MGAGVPAELDTPNLPSMLRQVAAEYPGASIRLAVVWGVEAAWQGAVTWDGGVGNYRIAVARDPLEALATALRLVLTYGAMPAAPSPRPAVAVVPALAADLAALLG